MNKIIFIFMCCFSFLLIGCQKDVENQESTQANNVELRSPDGIWIHVTSTEVDDCCITMKLMIKFPYNSWPLEGSNKFYVFVDGVLSESIYAPDLDWSSCGSSRWCAEIKACHNGDGEDPQEICINDQEDLYFSGPYLFEPFCSEVYGGCICGYYLCWASGNSEPEGIDFHADTLQNLVAIVNGEEKKMNNVDDLGANPYNLPLYMGGCWDNPTCSVFNEISDWLVTYLNYDGTILSSYDGLGCNKGGNGLSDGIFLLNDGSVHIELDYITVTGNRFSNLAWTFYPEFNSHCF